MCLLKRGVVTSLHFLGMGFVFTCVIKEKMDRSFIAEKRFGSPDLDLWNLYDDATQLPGVRKGALVRAYHCICKASGESLDEARLTINTCTRALQKEKRREYLEEIERNECFYSEVNHYGFLYLIDSWVTTVNKEVQLDKTKDALSSKWAFEVAKRKNVSIDDVKDHFSNVYKRELGKTLKW